MIVKVMNEYGYEEAIVGLSLSHGVPYGRARKVAENLATKDYGHNKFLEAIMVYLDITAPRFWWQEADTYRLSTKQSESTMHTIQKRVLTQEDFEQPIPEAILVLVNEYIRVYNENKSILNLVALKNILPEGFLQRRVWVVSYKTLRNIIRQRKDHRLPQWRDVFVPQVLTKVQYPWFLSFDE